MADWDDEGLCKACENFLLFSLAKLCLDVYNLSPVDLDECLSTEAFLVPIADHPDGSCCLCLEIARNLVPGNPILIGIELTADRTIHGICRINISDDDRAVHVHTLHDVGQMSKTARKFARLGAYI